MKHPAPPTAVNEPSLGVTVTATAALRKRCPHKDEEDHGTVTVSWMVTEKTIELHALAAYFEAWADVEISHEAITAAIMADVSEAGVDQVTVTAIWTTAGMTVTTEMPAASWLTAEVTA